MYDSAEVFLVSTIFDHAVSINIIILKTLTHQKTIIFAFDKKKGRRNFPYRQKLDEPYNKCDLAWSLELNRYGLTGGL